MTYRGFRIIDTDIDSLLTHTDLYMPVPPKPHFEPNIHAKAMTRITELSDYSRNYFKSFYESNDPLHQIEIFPNNPAN